MKKIIILLSLVTITTFIISCNNKKGNLKNSDSSYAIIPQPKSLHKQEGRFSLGDNVGIQASEELLNEGNYLTELLSKTTFNKAILNGENANISLAINNSIENKEGYKLNISNDKVSIEGKTPAGVFYGIQSLYQLIQKENDNFYLPAVEIIDAPRFLYRGAMLDVGRHFFSVDFVKKYIDLIALHKMNRFHLHLTEDQGWRIEIKKYPKLTEIGSVRNGTIVGHYPGKENDETPHKGFYSQEDIKHIVDYATKKHIIVIPEIELPGHSQATIAAYPFLSAFPKEVTEIPNDMMSKQSRKELKEGKIKFVQESWGVRPDILVPSEETFTFLEDVLTEVIELFPSKYIHIGGDEAPKQNWKRSEFCQNLIKKLNLKDEHELQSYFIQRIEKFLNSKGKQIIGWDEILEGGLAENATVMSWRGIKGGIEAAKQKHNVIMTPTDYCYIDYYQAKPVDKEPLSIGGYLPVEKMYSYEPIPEELSEEEHKYILGTQVNLWTEYVATEEYAEYMALPRLTALSEVSWSSKENKNWESFKNRLAHIVTIYDALGYNYAKHVLEGYEWQDKK